MKSSVEYKKNIQIKILTRIHKEFRINLILYFFIEVFNYNSCYGKQIFEKVKYQVNRKNNLILKNIYPYISGVKFIFTFS